MGTSITIPDLPEETHAELRARASASGQSLQEYLRSHLVEMVSKPEKPDMNTLIARIHERKKRTGTNVSVETILADLDAERQ